MLILQQPRSHIPLFEADYEALRSKQQHFMEAHRVSSHLHVPPAPRAAERVSERLRLRLPAKPSAEIVHHDQRVDAFKSVPPFDRRFPSFPHTKERVVLFSVSPFDSRFPTFISRPSSPRRVLPRPVLDSDVKDLEISSFSPFDARFPSASDSHFHRRSSPEHRRHRNRSFIKKRRLQAAIAQYRREIGPVSSRPLFDPEDRKFHPVDPSVPSYSPWQEAQFAVHCVIPLPKFVNARNLKAVTKEAAAILRPRLMKTKKPRYVSYSPFSPMFPSFASPKAAVTTLAVPAKKAVVAIPQAAMAAAAAAAAVAFPAYSPMAKHQQQPATGAGAGFKLPAATKAAEKPKLPRQPSLHMH